MSHSLKSLETEDSEFLTESNMKKGQTVLLKVKGKKYTSTIVEIYGKLVTGYTFQRALYIRCQSGHSYMHHNLYSWITNVLTT